MKKLLKRIASLSVAVIMTSCMINMSAFAENHTISNSKNELYYSGGETTTNYYVTYSRGKNKTGQSRFHIVNSTVYDTSNHGLTYNSSADVTANNAYRSCYANIGADNVKKSWHKSIIKTTTSYSSTIDNTLTAYIYYND